MAYINPSKSTEWGTPKNVFDELNREFHFTLDACASAELAKCERYFDKQEDALSQPWERSTFCNPPYGPVIAKWIQKAYQEFLAGKTVVMLLPARTDTIWFHGYCLDPAVEVRFLKGRLSFIGSRKERAPFPSMIVIFRGK
jgi:site-specific DNA-methyltransferase (adenine-specific)